jgi:hypothetical protein
MFLVSTLPGTAGYCRGKSGGDLAARRADERMTEMSYKNLENGVNWYLNVLYMGGADAADVAEAHRHLFHCFRKMFDAGYIQQPIEPVLPADLVSER